MFCDFQELEPGKIRCIRCQRTLTTRRPASEAKAICKLRGLGDVVASVTSAVGIKPCGGCKERQAALNRLVPFQ